MADLELQIVEKQQVIGDQFRHLGGDLAAVAGKHEGQIDIAAWAHYPATITAVRDDAHIQIGTHFGSQCRYTFRPQHFDEKIDHIRAHAANFHSTETPCAMPLLDACLFKLQKPLGLAQSFGTAARQLILFREKFQRDLIEMSQVLAFRHRRWVQ